MDKMNFDKVIGYGMQFLDKLSTKGLYIILLLYYTYQSKEVPSWSKKIIIGSLAYLLNPIDAIPDLTPILGMTDDLSVLAFGLVTIACYISDDIREKAEKKLRYYLKRDIDKGLIQEVNSWL